MRRPYLGWLTVGALVMGAGGCTTRNEALYGDLGAGGTDGAADAASGDRGPEFDMSNGDVNISTIDLLVPDSAPPADAGPAPDRASAPDTAPTPDLRPPPDTAPWPDVAPWPDLAPPPDAKPWQCAKNSDCDDKNSCTVDSCTPQHTCLYKVLPGYCVINKVCYASGKSNPGDPCQICDPGQSTSAWSTKANGAVCTADGIHCTDDTCQAGKCVNTLKSGWCLISKTCHVKGKFDPQNACRWCDPTTSTSAWSNRPSGVGCTSDGLTCTTDTCQAGTCTHKLTGGCIIGGKCVAEGDTKPGDVCSACVGSLSTSAYTFVSGRPCASGSGMAPMCAAGACRAWSSSTFLPDKKTSDAVLRSVDYISANKAVFAVGGARLAGTNTDQGFFRELGTAAQTTVQVTEPLYDLHGGLAVGRNGAVYRAAGSAGWSKATVSGMGANDDPLSVWGHATAAQSGQYYLTGANGTTLPGVLACTLTGASLACSKHSGVAGSAVLGRVFGVLASGKVAGVWALDMATSGPEDIYYHAGSGTTWSTAAPAGCKDGGASGSTACSGSGGALLGVHGTSGTDVWVAGTGGLLLHFDGKAWKALSVLSAGQSSYRFGAVFASTKEPLVLVAAQRQVGLLASLEVLAYNTALKTWYGPMPLLPLGDLGTQDLIYDLGGNDTAELYMVGQRRVGSILPLPTNHLEAWVLQLK